MIIKLFAKLWPALTPILFYIFWTYIVEGIIFKRLFKKSKTIEGTKIVGEKSTIKTSPPTFSFKNRKFLISLYASVIIAIISLIFFALSDIDSKNSNYIPAKYENGQITPSQFN